MKALGLDARVRQPGVRSAVGWRYEYRQDKRLDGPVAGC